MLDRIQEHLEAIYGIRCELRAADFVLDVPEAAALGGTGRGREELLVHQTEEALEVALVMPRALVRRLAPFEDAPAQAVEQVLGDFCEAAEGVSHFLYLSRAAELDRSVSLLELEAQAEIDKFAACVLLRWGRDVPAFARALHERLFVRHRLRDDLSAEERERYAQANQLAMGFCAALLPLIARRHLDGVLSALRYVYRLGAEAKLRHLAWQSR